MLIDLLALYGFIEIVADLISLACDDEKAGC